MPFRRKFPFAPTKDGRFATNLSADEQEVLENIPNQLTALLGAEGDVVATGGSTRRLFPTAYANDADRDAEFQQLMREDLVASKMAAAQVLSETARETTLSEEQLIAWMGAINDLRLVIGTQLDVQEDTDHDDIDPEHPDAYRFMIYRWLSMLLEHIVRALSGDEPEDLD